VEPTFRRVSRAARPAFFPGRACQDQNVMTLALRLPLAAGLLALALAAPALAQQGGPMQIQPPAAAKATSAKPAVGKPKAVSADDQEAIDQANAYFNGVRTMVAEFKQVGADGRRSEGELQLQKPGKMRFEYSPPSPLEIISDGKSVAVRDRKLNTQDLYLIGQTPLKFLLKDQIDLARDTKVLGVARTEKAVTITIEDKATLGGTSRIKLVFDPEPFALKQWTVSDPQGGDTTVSLANVDLQAKPEASAFRINTERMLGNNN
jgi:outer membrane lipoprotein-sorting protein